MFYCEHCKKELRQEEDWFMVKDELWKKISKGLSVSQKSIVCTQCFEDALEREILVSDLKLLGGTREAPINFWIIRKYMDRSRITYIRNQQQYVMGLIKDNPEKADKFRRKCRNLIKYLQDGGNR